MKVVVITGASSGIGNACVKHYLLIGWKVVAAARNIEKLKDIKHEYLLVLHCDVTIKEDCKNLIDKTISAFGKIDCLINNAGISMRALFEDCSLSVLEQLMQTNFWGAVYCTKYAIKHLIQNKGTVVGISSIAGKIPLPGRTGYSASKFAMEGFFETLRLENVNTGLNVVIIRPGFTKSNIRNIALIADGSSQMESPRNENDMMSSEDVAKKIFDAVQIHKRELTLTLQGKLAILFYKLFPNLIDKLIYKTMTKEVDSPLKK